jgi:hypothetical protein
MAYADPELHQYEIASIANLCPQSNEEATTLLPSLKKCNPDSLQATLDELVRYKAVRYLSCPGLLLPDADSYWY